MELAILEFSEKFMYDNNVNITPSVLCKFLDALEEKFNSRPTGNNAPPTATPFGEIKTCLSCNNFETCCENKRVKNEVICYGWQNRS